MRPGADIQPLEFRTQGDGAVTVETDWWPRIRITGEFLRHASPAFVEIEREHDEPVTVRFTVANGSALYHLWKEESSFVGSKDEDIYGGLLDEATLNTSSAKGATDA